MLMASPRGKQVSCGSSRLWLLRPALQWATPPHHQGCPLWVWAAPSEKSSLGPWGGEQPRNRPQESLPREPHPFVMGTRGQDQQAQPWEHRARGHLLCGTALHKAQELPLVTLSPRPLPWPPRALSRSGLGAATLASVRAVPRAVRCQLLPSPLSSSRTFTFSPSAQQPSSQLLRF